MKKAMVILVGITLFLQLFMIGTALGGTQFDPNQDGSVEIHMKCEGKPLEGGSLTFYRVGEIVSTDGNYGYEPVGIFRDAKVSLEDVRSPELAETLTEHATGYCISGEKIPIRNGIARLSVPKEKQGLYLVVQEELSEGYRACSPFLIGMPNYNGKEYDYRVVATPKVGTIEQEPETPEGPHNGDLDMNGAGSGSQNPTGGYGDGDFSGGDYADDYEDDTFLPQTGTLNWPVPVLTISGLLLLFAGILYNRTQKRHRS